MASKRATIAQAVADALAAASGSPALLDKTFVLSRKAVPLTDLKDLKGLTLTVVTDGREQRKLVTRRDVQKIFEVQIGVQNRLTTTCDPASPQGNPEVDALMEFCEQVALYFQPDGTLQGVIGNGLATWCEDGNGISNYEMDHLLRLRTFTSYVTLSLRYF